VDALVVLVGDLSLAANADFARFLTLNAAVHRQFTVVIVIPSPGAGSPM
jgi:hypothetical protein